MDKDLFRVDLNDLTFNDILRFAATSRPETERPQENVRLDFKREVPNDLGDDVTAFANTYGGLILIGIEADKNKQNIPVAISGIKGNPDIKSSIVNKILSTVYPRPSFSIGVIKCDDKQDHVVVVIRVEESRITPHMYIAEHKNKISIRIEDNNKYASLQQIEALFERTKRFASEDFITQRLSDLYVFQKDNATEGRSGNFQKVTLVPFDDLNIRLDRRLEQDFFQLIMTHIIRDKEINADHRHAKYYQIEARNKDTDYHRIWRLYTSGAVEFISQLGKGIPRQENLGDMIVDTISIIAACKKFIDEFNYFGKTYFQHEISIVKSTKLLPQMPPPNYMGNYDVMHGISLERDTIDSSFIQNQHKIIRYLDYSDIETPDEIIAESFLEHLRMIFHGKIDFDKLLESIQWLSKALKRKLYR